MRLTFYLLALLIFSSCFLVKKKTLKLGNALSTKISHSDDFKKYALNDFDIYVLSMDETQTEITKKNRDLIHKDYANKLDKKGDYTIEELYLLVSKKPQQGKRKIWYLTSFHNQFVTSSCLDKFKEDGYQYYYFLNTPLHKKSILISELDFLMPGEMKNDTIYIKQNSLVSFNHVEELKISFKKIGAGDDEIIEFISVDNDDRGAKRKKNNSRVTTRSKLKPNIKFKRTKRKIGYVPINGFNVQFADSLYTSKCNYYFVKTKDTFNTNNGRFKYLWFKKRYLNAEHDCRCDN